jgi:solute carrier family 25, member 42
MMQGIVAGGLSGILAKTVIAPAERVKMSFQTTKEKFSLRGALTKGTNIVKNDGVLALWRGHSTTVLRVAPYAGLSYASHDVCEKELKIYYKTDSLPMFQKFLAGSFGGAVGTLLTYPLDVLRVRLALIPGSTWAQLLKQGRFYQGLSPTMLGIVPYSGVCWSVKQTLSELHASASERKATVMESLFMNGVAGLTGQFVTYPLDVARRRMQLFPEQYKSTWGTLTELYATEGMRGVSKGFSLNIIKGPITLSISLTAYDMLRLHFRENYSNNESSD